MRRSIFLLFLAALAAFTASDQWQKVREIKSGTELRIYKKGTRQPVIAKMDEATEEKLIIALKTEQTSIAKDDIDRIDARSDQSGRRVVAETKSITSVPNHSASPRDNVGGSGTPGTSSSSGLSIGGKPDFVTVYRRAAAAAAK